MDAGHYEGNLWIATEIMILNVFNLYMHYMCILSVTILKNGQNPCQFITILNRSFSIRYSFFPQ